MSKNTVNIARAISLLSEVISREAVDDETAEDIADIDENNEFDDLKEQALDFGQELADDLSIISDELDRTLELSEIDDDDDDTWEDDDDAEADDAADGDDADKEKEETTSDDGDEPSPTPESANAEEADALQKTTAGLEKSNEELTDKVEDLTEALQHIDTLINDLNVRAKEFVSEIETL